MATDKYISLDKAGPKLAEFIYLCVKINILPGQVVTRRRASFNIGFPKYVTSKTNYYGLDIMCEISPVILVPQMFRMDNQPKYNNEMS